MGLPQGAMDVPLFGRAARSGVSFLEGPMPKLSLTPSLVEKAACPADKRKIDLFDDKTKGLMLEVRPNGKTFYLRYQSKRGITRQMRLGDARDLSLSQARNLADKTRTQIAQGEDPMESKAVARNMPRFAEFIEKQYLPYVSSYKRSLRTDISMFKNHLLPRFGQLYLDDIRRVEIQKMHLERRASGAATGSANRLVVMMSHIFNMAIKWEVPGITQNPCKGIALLPENNKRERYLSAEEAVRLYRALDETDNACLTHIVAMLLLSGARKREVLDAQWVDFDLERQVWRIPLSKSGKARHVPLSNGMLTLLARVQRAPGQMWLFPNPATGKPYVNIHFAWDNARRRAGLPDVRLHDLRHSFASMLINGGRSLYEVQRILGHAHIKTTQRYAHLSPGVLLEAANVATETVGKVFLPGATPSRILTAENKPRAPAQTPPLPLSSRR